MMARVHCKMARGHCMTARGLSKSGTELSRTGTGLNMSAPARCKSEQVPGRCVWRNEPMIMILLIS